LVEAPEPLAPLPGMPVVLEDPFVPPLGPEPGVPLGDATVPVPGEFMLPFALPLPEALAPVPEPVVPAEPAPPLLAPPAPAWARAGPQERAITVAAHKMKKDIRVFISWATSHIDAPFLSGRLMRRGSAKGPISLVEERTTIDKVKDISLMVP
jgi:hypothetical protein